MNGGPFIMGIKKTLTPVRELHRNTSAYADKTVTVGGWIRNMRASNAFGFIDLNDGTFFKSIQVVIESEKIDNYDLITHQNIGAALTVTGVLALTPGSKQPFELKAASVEIAGTSTPDYPLQPKRHSPEFLRSVAHLRPRTNTYSAVFRVRSVAAQAIHEFFAQNNFIYVNTPIITCSDCEGAGEMFKVTTLDINEPPRNEDGSVNYGKDFFGKAANLTVSGQLQAECFALAFSNVYTFGPTFRAEVSNTPRHAAEFWMIEPELAFADLEDYMDTAEAMTKYAIRFYMRANDDGKTVAAADMLVPGVGELIGGSQREERLDVLEKKMDELGLEKEGYWWYLELRKYGGVKHAGYGLGFERLIMYITGMSNIRDVEAFPRTTGSAEF